MTVTICTPRIFQDNKRRWRQDIRDKSFLIWNTKNILEEKKTFSRNKRILFNHYVSDNISINNGQI